MRVVDYSIPPSLCLFAVSDKSFLCYLLLQKITCFKCFITSGSYFDASCILDDQESRFSVIAVGAVTCYLLNK